MYLYVYTMHRNRTGVRKIPLHKKKIHIALKNNSKALYTLLSPPSPAPLTNHLRNPFSIIITRMYTYIQRIIYLGLGNRNDSRAASYTRVLYALLTKTNEPETSRALISKLREPAKKKTPPRARLYNGRKKICRCLYRRFATIRSAASQVIICVEQHGARVYRARLITIMIFEKL